MPPITATIADIRGRLLKGDYRSEAAISSGIVLRVLQTLGWDVFDPESVIPEFSLEGWRVDFALCQTKRKPCIFVEVKAVGQSAPGERQLFEYAFHLGVPMAILTDGREWNFYLPGEQGNYEERQFYKLDICARDPEESAERLERYLSHDAIKSGRAIEVARTDYRDLSKIREIKSHLPLAWRELVNEPDELLVELLCERVETICGYRPEIADAVQFLRSVGPTAVQPLTDTNRKTPTTTSKPASSSSPPQTGNRHNYELLGEARTGRSAMDIVIQLFLELNRRDEHFFGRFSQLEKHGRKRRFLARRPEELYPDRPDLQRDFSKEIIAGWWIGTNFANREKHRMVEAACDVANLQFGRDIKIDF